MCHFYNFESIDFLITVKLSPETVEIIDFAQLRARLEQKYFNALFGRFKNVEIRACRISL